MIAPFAPALSPAPGRGRMVISRYYLSKINLVEYRKYIVIPMGDAPAAGAQPRKRERFLNDFSSAKELEK
jgi:hypothetical protein